MAKGIFVHRTDSIYDDSPAEQYQFPRQYLARVSACIGDWIIYYEPSKIRDTSDYFAVAKVENVVPDPINKDMYLALIERGSHLDFPNAVPFNGPMGLVERAVMNDQGKISGRAQSAVRPLSNEDFNRIIDLGLAENVGAAALTDRLQVAEKEESRSPQAALISPDQFHPGDTDTAILLIRGMPLIGS
jgi:putative restriction endonuclease